MAPLAAHPRRVDLDVRVSEGRCAQVMTLRTGLPNGLRHQPVLGGRVRLVTTKAVTRRGRVDMSTAHGGLERLVAGEAQIGSLREHQARECGLVRVVARGALALKRRLVLGLVRGHRLLDIGMAGSA